jgi:succinate dehydrogenase / fumarate reductase flavoprotein subunit
VFLDIAWIKEKLPKAAEHIKKRLPSMYHQFKQLADIDITEQPMEIGPTTHYVMGGVRVDGDSQMTAVPGLFAAGEVAAGLHGSNRLGGNSLSDLLVFGQRAGEYAAQYAGTHEALTPDQGEVEEAVRVALAPFDRKTGENPFRVQSDLQRTMQDLVGIVRRQDEMERALAELDRFAERARTVGVPGGREYNPAWHTALDLVNLLTVSRAVVLSALERTESRGGHFRDDFPEKNADYGSFNVVVVGDTGGPMSLRREPIPGITPELQKIVAELE